ncbi:MAG: TAXI family TRAP transporter solute-binding subunit [Halobacteria archaeon]|nr:TAXI family TRAP transporter solute-binding subunit [Halobacteria archaeon]
MRLLSFGSAALITLLGFVIAWQFVNPAPPRSLVIATGDADGAYYLFARRYRELLAENGIELEVRTTAGSIENLELLQNGSVDLAFVQGGTGAAMDTDTLTSLGSLYYEPLWIFYRGEQTLDRLGELQGKRIAIGEHGSGTHAIASLLLADNFIDTETGNIQSIGGATALQALQQGQIDALFLVAAPAAPLVQQLLYAQDVQLMSFARASAYTRMHPFLSAVTLPEGVIDLQANIPPRDTVLLAATANLVTQENFHHALISLLLQAARDTHDRGDLFSRPGNFPNNNNLEFRLNDDARRFYRHGPPFLQRYLPFGAASLIDRLKVMLVPLLTLLLPLVKIMPPAYRWRVRKKIYRWYGELQELDNETQAQHGEQRVEVLLQTLDKLEEEVRKVTVPLSYADELYELRLHIGLVRNRLQDNRDQGTP